ncbi:MAG: hypothetical protein AAGD38_05710 [Acidobacteriota bacterium]
MSQKELQRLLDECVNKVAEPPREIRVFWKLQPGLMYAGCNGLFAADAGFSTPDEFVGRTDFDPRVPWTRQAAKYQADDRETIGRAEPKLFILERQEREEGVFWVHTGKAPILDESGKAVGVLGMYETIDNRMLSDVRRRQAAYEATTTTNGGG